MLGTLVVDELHLVGDASRGYLLEIFLSKAGRIQLRMVLQHHAESLAGLVLGAGNSGALKRKLRGVP